MSDLFYFKYISTVNLMLLASILATLEQLSVVSPGLIEKHEWTSTREFCLVIKLLYECRQSFILKTQVWPLNDFYQIFQNCKSYPFNMFPLLLEKAVQDLQGLHSSCLSRHPETLYPLPWDLDKKYILFILKSIFTSTTT
jgi:hypothetical protein